MTNSRNKGASGEREARKYLLGLGFEVSPRNIQPRGGKMDGPDLVISGKVTVEVKRSGKIALGTKALRDACEQATANSSRLLDGQVVAWDPWIVLWRRDGNAQWYCTCEDVDRIVTCDDDTSIILTIRRLLDR